MANWNDVTRAAPDIAKLAQARIEATGLGFIATLRRDGFPRISGIEPLFMGGELWLGMMPASLKGKDLERDPRFSLHNASVDKELKDGDVKITGRAVLVDDLATRQRFHDEILAETGNEIGMDFYLFRADVTEVATVRPGGDHLVIESWREGEAPKRVERR